MIQLRPYQTQVITETRQAYKARHRAVLLCMPTGAGKTMTASTIVHGASAKGNVTWWLTHRRELAAQASQTFHSLGIPHGTVQAGYVSNPHATVQVASIQTIVRRLDELPPPDLIVFDECVSGDSVVETNRGPMFISDIRAEDDLRALCQIDGRLEYRRITKAWKSGNRATIRLCLSNGAVLTCTPEHRIYLEGQWREARTAKSGDRLASPAAFASAAAVRLLPETTGAEREAMCPATRTEALGLTGMRNTAASSSALRNVLAAAVSQFALSLVTLLNSARNAIADILASCSDTTSGLPATAFAYQISSVRRYSGRSLGTEVSVFQTSDPAMPAYPGRTESHRRGGFITRLLRSGGSSPLSASRGTMGSETLVSGCIHPASLASPKSGALCHPPVARPSAVNGSMRSEMLGWPGGIATTGIGPTQCSFIQRDIPKRKTASSPTVSGRPPSCMTSAGARISEFTSNGRAKSSNVSGHSCPTAWPTNCPTIERIEAGPTIDVYDLTVDEAHNFFANGVLVHNCHHIGAASWDTIFHRFPLAKILGLTATPWRLDGAGLGRWFTHMVLGPSTAELIAEGSLSRYRLFAPATPDLSGIAMAQGDYQRGALAKAMAKPQIVGDAIGHYLKLCAGKRAVAFAAGVENSRQIAAQFCAAGVRAEHVDGAMSAEERDAAVERFRRGETLVLSNADLFGEGFDVPAIEAAILLRPTKSLSLHLQQVGRALRPSPGKGHAIILDHAGNSLTHGLPDDEREWSLEDRERRKRSAPAEVSIRQCDNCFFVFRPAPKCPQCGETIEVKARAIEVVEGELAEVRKIAAQRQRRLEEADCRTLDDWRRLAEQRGYKPGWAMHRWQARQRRAA